MLDFFQILFSTDGFPPRWHCGTGWQQEPGWGWMLIISDIAIWGAYMVIPFLLASLIRLRPEIRFRSLLWLCVGFIFLCGTTHFIDAILFWQPVYRLSAISKLATACVSWATVIIMAPVIPKLVRVRLPEELEEEVRQRTRELQTMTQQLQLEIANRENLSRKLLEEHMRLDVALRAGGMGTWDLNLINHHIAMDHQQRKLLEIDPDSSDLIIDVLYEKIHPSDLDIVRQAIEFASTNLGELHKDFRIITRDGHVRWIAARGKIEINEETRKPIRLSGVTYDVTEVHVALETVAENEAILKSTLDSTADSVITIDLLGYIQSINDPSIKVMEIDDAKHLRGQPWTALWPEIVQAEMKQAMQLAIKESVGRFQGTWPTLSGKIKHWDVIVTPILDANQEVDCLLCTTRDITELKEAQKQKEFVDHQFRVLADNIVQFAWMARPDGDIYWYNKRWMDYTGSNLEEMQGDGWRKVQHPQHLERVAHKFQMCLESGQRWEDTFPLLGADGKYRWFLSRAVPIKNAAGEIQIWLGTNTDITEQMEAEQEIAEAHSQLKSIFDTAADAIVTVDIDGKILSINPAFERMFNFDQKTIIGNSLVNYLPSISFAHGESIACSGREVYGLRSNGIKIPLEVSFSGTDSKQGWAWTGVIRDVTVRKETEKTLRMRTSALDAATNSIIITDALQHDNPIVYANPAFSNLTGYSVEEVIGSNCRMLQGEQTDQEQISVIRKAVRNHEGCHVTLLNYTKSGAQFWNDLNVSPIIDESGMVTHFVGIQNDISDRIQYEEWLRVARREADSANQAKTEFLANMSHEIRTPLTAILGCADTLYREVQDTSPRDLVRVIRDQGQLLLGILNDVLDLSKIEAGKLDIHIKPSPFVRVIGEVHSLMHSQAVEKGLTLDTTYETRIPDKIETDPLRLRQILLNLVGNAIKFTHTGGIRIKVSCYPSDDGYLVDIRVIDTGIGIPEDRIVSIFEAFSQEKDEVAPSTTGTGLGLTICQKLIRMLNGHITVESQRGKGSSFTIRLPLGAIKEGDLKTPDELLLLDNHKQLESEPDPHMPLKILIAEDTRGIQVMLKRFLQNLVDHLDVVGNGEEAVNFVNQAAKDGKPYDVVLMDMQMPVMNGYMATRILRDQGYTMPVIALTAGAMAGDRDKCIAAGCSYYLPKPIDRNELLSRLRGCYPSSG
jgi:PAS domain S-box-containing protein